MIRFANWETRFCVETTRFHAPYHEVLGWARSKVSFPLIILHCTRFTSVISTNTLFCKPKLCVFHFAPNPSFLYRKEQKRSHTLRYVLKNRKTGKVLLVVLFTLYLNEDLDEQGNVKPGVETGVPFDKMDKDKAARLESKRDDVAVDESDAKGSFGEKKKDEKFYEGDDDVD